MKWLDELPKAQAEQVRRIMLWRDGCLKRYASGLMDMETARIGVRLCNEMIAEICEKEKMARRAAVC